MCGVTGFFGVGDEQVLQRMASTIRHRGPDAEGFCVEGDRGVFLGHRRLSIVDIAGV
jgi:asparagine synthase (glutamine-hydrolysing)